MPEDTDRLRGCALPAGSGAGFGASSGALTAIQLRFREPLKLETVAKEQYVNAAYLGRIFRAQTGQSFRDALTEERMRRAERLLRQQVSVSDTAVAVGYSDSNYFSRAYKKYFGHSPSESGPLRTH